MSNFNSSMVAWEWYWAIDKKLKFLVLCLMDTGSTDLNPINLSSHHSEIDSFYKQITRDIENIYWYKSANHRCNQDAGFIILDGIRMLCEKMYTLILHFNFYTNIILVFKFIKGILFFLDLNGETRGKNNAL